MCVITCNLNVSEICIFRASSQLYLSSNKQKIRNLNRKKEKNEINFGVSAKAKAKGRVKKWLCHHNISWTSDTTTTAHRSWPFQILTQTQHITPSIKSCLISSGVLWLRDSNQNQDGCLLAFNISPLAFARLLVRQDWSKLFNNPQPRSQLVDYASWSNLALGC